MFRSSGITGVFGKMRLGVLVISFSLLWSLQGQSQVVFDHTLGDPACYEEAYGILPTGNGDYLVSAAYNCSGGVSNWKGKLIRLNSQGDTIWTRPDLHANGFFRKTTDGNYIFFGGNHAGLDYDTIVVTKTNEQGDTIWTRHLFFGQCNNLAYDLINTQDNGYALCGIYAPDCTGATADNSFVTKLDETGAVQWTTLLKGPGNDELFEIRQLSNGGYALFGWTDSYGAGLADNYLVMLNAQGDSIFSKTYGDSTANYGYGMDLLPHSGGFITIGYSDSTYIMKLSMAGDVEWKRGIGIPTGSIYFKARYTKDKHFAFIGCENDTLGLGCSATLYKTDTLGNLLWRKNFGSLFRDFTEDKPGSFLMSGYSIDTFPVKPKAYYVRFDTTYNPLDTINIGIEEVNANSIEVRILNNLVERSEPIVFRSSSFDLTTVAIYDVLGRIQSTAANRQSITLPNPFGSGIYIWQATIDGQTVSGKLMVR